MFEDFLKSIIYTGPSMNPTLKAPDLMRVLPYQGKKIRCGDVIVFPSPENKGLITHRVVRVTAQGIRTRGDNSNRVDPWVISPHNIVGRVIYVQRVTRRCLIYSGLIGRLYSLVIRLMRMIDRKISFLLHPVYRSLARTGIFRRHLPAWMQTRLLCFKRSTGTEMQLLIGRHIIGRLLPEKKQWLIRRPFRLFLDEASLKRMRIDGESCAS